MSEPDESSIFDIARRILEHDVRSDYVDQACGDNAALKARVEALLQANDESPSFMELPPTGASEPLADTTNGFELEEKAGTIVGQYKLLQKVGEGGFGVVYMAEQSSPVRRKVALKIIKPGMDSKEVIARFEAERQALALMDHPNIAKVFDGGTTDTGKPYFVMELVKGVPMTEFCDKNKLATRRRLELFSAVCRAIQHAHQKGIIHRDIKPSNVMITLHDGKPVPKIIDFGVSKAITQQLTEKTMFTAYGQMIGTPQYMSPEQAEMSGLDIDTRSDVYSLGVLLYELLTGDTPLKADSLRGKAYIELQRMIREDDPPLPSIRLSTQGELTASVAAQRGTDPKRLGALVRGELDWIVMKALEKERSHRYETANGLAMDVDRYLNDEAVEACPPSWRYRMRKFVRRNTTLVVAGGAISAALLIGFIGASWGMWEAQQANIELAAANQRAIRRSEELITANRAIASFLLDQALVAALSAEEIRTGELIEKLELSSGATGCELELVRGLLNRSLNRADSAYKHFLRATELDESSVAAWSCLAEYNFVLQNGEYRSAMQTARELPKKTYLDHLLFGSATGISGGGNAGKAIPHIQKSIALHDTALARIQLALHLSLHAINSNDPLEIEQARDNLDRGRSLTGMTYFTAMTQMIVFHSATLLARRTNADRAEIERLIASASEGAEIVEAKMVEGSPLIHWTLANHYEWFEPNRERARRHWNSMLEDSSARLERYVVGIVLRDEGAQQAIELTETGARDLRAILLALTPGCSDEALKIWREEFKPNLLIVPVLLGRTEEAKEACEENANLRDRYAVERITEAEFMAQSFIGSGHFHAALKALANGQREKAQNHLQKCVLYSSYGSKNKSFATGLLAQMKRDPTWPQR